MRKTLALLALIAILAPAVALGQALSINGRYFCNTRATDSTPFITMNATTDQWCPSSSFNPSGADVDICFEGDTDENLLCTDAGNDEVCISCTDPASLFDVRGDAGAAGTITASTAELTVVDGDELGCLNFQAPLETGADAILVASAICAEADGTFAATVNEAELVFKTASSEAAAEKMRLDKVGNLGINTAIPSTLLEVQADAGAAGTITASSAELTVVDGDELGCLNFQAPLETDGTDAILVGAALCGEADNTFSATVNETELVFKTGASEVAAEKMRLTSGGNLGINTDIPSTLLEVQADAGAAGTATLSTAELTVVDGDELGRINFQAPLESAGTDAILVGAAIYAEADNTFSATVNETELVFATGASEAAAEKMRLTSGGNLGINTDIPSTLLEVQADAGAAGLATLSTAELTVVDGDKLGQINFQAPLESDGTDAILVAASIYAEADATFGAADNSTRIVFATGQSEAAAEKVAVEANGILLLKGFTADPCTAGAPAGGIFYNATSNYLCYCNGTNDVKTVDDTTACF